MERGMGKESINSEDGCRWGLVTIAIFISLTIGTVLGATKTLLAQTPEICNNGADDDGDGLIDCFDGVDCPTGSNCHDSTDCPPGLSWTCVNGTCDPSACVTETCNDGLDNDDDGLVDCFDTVDCPTGSDCHDSAGCLPGHSWTCEGVSCTPGPYCPSGDCGNGICDTGSGENCNNCVLDCGCTSGEFCGSDNTCQPTPTCQSDSDCDDSFACTNDTCDNGECSHIGDPNYACPLSACGETQYCYTELGANASIPTDPSGCELAHPCNDGDDCTADTCGGDGQCQHTPMSTGSSCNTVCITDGTCDSDGICTGGTPTICDDGDQCTTDSCTGSCQHDPVNIDDGIACTHDSCDPVTGVSHTPDDSFCFDASVCTDEVCNPASGCVYTNNTAPCNDGDACTTGEVCSGGICDSALAVGCDDNNLCTTDSCDPATGCMHAAKNCDDGNPCTTDSCSVVTKKVKGVPTTTATCGHKKIMGCH